MILDLQLSARLYFANLPMLLHLELLMIRRELNKSPIFSIKLIKPMIDIKDTLKMPTFFKNSESVLGVCYLHLHPYICNFVSKRLVLVLQHG